MAAALQQIGVDPTSHSLWAEYLKQFLAPLIQARGESLGLGAGDGDQTSYLSTLGDFARSFTTAGRNGFQEAANYANGILGNSAAFAQATKDNTPQQTRQVLQNLLSLTTAGLNPYLQAGAQNVFDDSYTNYQLDQLGLGPGGPDGRFGGKSGGLFTDYARQDQQSPIARLLAGMYGR